VDNRIGHTLSEEGGIDRNNYESYSTAQPAYVISGAVVAILLIYSYSARPEV
jgi:hypothetical protein